MLSISVSLHLYFTRLDYLWSSVACGDRGVLHGEELPELLELLLERGGEARVVGDHHVLVVVLARLLGLGLGSGLGLGLGLA